MATETILTDNQICKTLIDAGILLVPQEITGYDIEIARAIEQAVLQSPEIQSLRKDAEAFRTMVSKRLTVCVRELGHEVEVFRDGECLSWPACGAHANDKERTAVARQAIVMAVAAMEQQK